MAATWSASSRRLQSLRFGAAHLAEGAQRLNRMAVPGECVLGESCPSLGSSKDANGKSRGSRACDHSFPTELHVGLKHCPDPNCRTLDWSRMFDGSVR